VADTRNHTIRAIVLASGAVTTFAGTAGVASVAIGTAPGILNTPSGIAVAPSGAVLLSTTHENAILSIK
jgi:hypothetical protein